ncbi:3-ketoacyl-(acyl-carrier-protein) reductase [Gracilibacillus halophilus YIM-C55.5]|uniref:3-ketoacyl-(Acyl-carrier-protein) reductase n=1 Tax=Gracilibacillus halophilus YIM-C55.5 TaxID=1308866 RepID=N4WCG9_9BACI|nr:SDR family oxidoreductase [Gracilibacillus halophilus]ENH96939.1 3-ketoacyl-(acyl-carrier-protein) reductase [Gracilibacillus halophilus YIM-C55.5]
MGHAFISAGTKGLGMQVVKAFLDAGHRVTTTYFRDEQRAKEIKEQYADKQLLVLQADVCNKHDLHNAVQQAKTHFGTIDYLINNAGPFIFERKKLLDHSEKEWDQMVRGNLDSVYHLLTLTVPEMRQQQFGRIVTYGFQGANTAAGWVNRSAFSAAKVGLVSLTKTIAYEEAENGITSNMVCPGDIVGEMKEATISESRQFEDAKTPIGRSGTGEDIARTVLFLCHEDSDMITGNVMDITGGMDVIHQNR